MKLTEKQKRFADYYIETGNMTESAKKAGYKQPHVQGSQNLEKLNVRNYIDERMEEKDNQRIASQDEVLQLLTDIARGNTTEQTLRGVGQGSQTIDTIEVSMKDRIKAAELLGKRYAMWTDKQQVEGNIGVTIVDDIGED